MKMILFYDFWDFHQENDVTFYSDRANLNQPVMHSCKIFHQPEKVPSIYLWIKSKSYFDK